MNSLIPRHFRSSLWEPILDLGHLESRLEKALGRAFPSLLAGNGGKESLTAPEWSPAVDITEDDKEFLVKAELPEMKKEEVKVTVENGDLTISGERKQEKEEKGKIYHRIERSYGSFLRSFTLPEGINREKVSAEFKNGVLEIHLPKDEKAKPQPVEVKGA